MGNTENSAFLTRRRIIALCFVALLGLCAASGFAIFGLEGIQTMLALKDQVIEWCASHPTSLLLALVILPAFGFPASPLLVLAGVVWGSTWQTCLLAILAMALNMSWTYFVAAGPAKSLVLRLLGSRGNRWTNIHPENLLRFTFMLRITPGIPLFLQNYILGLLGVPFLKYIAVSVPLNGIYVVGFVLTGGAIFEGQAGMVFVGISVLIVAVLGTHLLRARLRANPVSPENMTG